jgi:hypothetical protein
MADHYDGIGEDEALTLYAAAVVGSPELAVQLERLGISEPHEALRDARYMRRDLLETVERARKECRG